MRLKVIAGGILLLGLISGCTNKPPEVPVITADADTFARVRDNLQRLDPTARIGQVSEVTPDDNRAAVGSIVTEDLKEGDIVTFMDGTEKILTTGKIVRVLPDSIHVKYEAPAEGSRAPVVGDLAIRFK